MTSLSDCLPRLLVALRPVQPVRAAIAVSDAGWESYSVQSEQKGEDLVGNKVPAEMATAQTRLERLSDKTVEEATRRFEDDSEE